MNQLDSATRQWLESLKLGKSFSSVGDFENGYNFSVIFDKLNLSKGRKFKNSSDMACIFHNYKNVKDLLFENFKVDFPINNIIYNTEQLLQTLRDQCIRYVENKKQSNLKSIIINQSINNQSKLINRQKQINTKLIMSQTQKTMPPKIYQIEKKLEKYREEKVRHQLLAIEQRKAEMENSRRAVSMNRQYLLTKLRHNHQFIKEQQQKVSLVVDKTQEIKRIRIEKQKQFNKFMDDKKNRLTQSLRAEEEKNYYDGLQQFQMNCIQQGIELEHDPNKPYKSNEGEFNKVVVLERIKDNIKKNQIDKKERIKRQNKKNIDAKEAREKSDMVWAQINLIEKYSKSMSQHFAVCQTIYKTKLRQKAESATIALKFTKRKFVDLPQFGNNQQRQAQLRKDKIIFLEKQVQRLQRRHLKYKSYAQQVFQALLHVTIIAEPDFVEKKGFTFSQWKNLQSQFLNFKPPKQNKQKLLQLSFNQKINNTFLLDYINYQGEWVNQQKLNNMGNVNMANIINKVIDISYPSVSLPNERTVPLYMPLKIAFIGDRLSGKTTLTAKIVNKYGVALIDPQLIIKQALQKAKPPPPEDNKKGAKKDAKKPQQETPQTIALKQFGSKLLQKIQSLEQATPHHYIEAIKFKLKHSFQMKNQEEVHKQFQQAKEKQAAKYTQALKDFQQAQKKPKKDSKKGGNQPVAEEPPSSNAYFYTSGFIIDSYPFNLQNIKLLERQLNNYIEESQRLNPRAQELKQQLSVILPIPKRQIDQNLHQGTFDMIFYLHATEQSLNNRNKGRKIDPQTNIVYHPTFNPPPADVKGLAQRLVEVEQVQFNKNNEIASEIEQFYSHFGDNRKKTHAFQTINTQLTVQQTFNKIKQNIQKRLLSKYQQLNQNQNQQKQLQNHQQHNNILQQQNIQEGQNLETIIQKLPRNTCQQILNRYIPIYQNYMKSIQLTLINSQEIRNIFFENLVSVQRSFTNVINRPNEKASKILNFEQNYNKLQDEKLSIVKDSQATKHLIEKIQQLNDQIWESLESKKNESINERLKFINSDWLNKQIVKLVDIATKFFQLQLNYLVQQLYFIFAINSLLQGKKVDFVSEYLTLGVEPNIEPLSALSTQSLDKSVRLDYIINQIDKCLNMIPQWIKKKQKKLKINLSLQLSSLMQKTIESEQNRISGRVKVVKNYIIQRILQEKCYYHALVNKMDDWILFGVQSQNAFIYQIFKNLKKCIQQAKKCSIRDIRVKPITDTHKPMSKMTENIFPIAIISKNIQLPLFDYKVFLQQIKCLSSDTQGKIQFKLFVSYFDKRKKSKIFNELFLSINYDTMQQYLVTDQSINFRQLALSVLLVNQPVCDQNTIADYSKSMQSYLNGQTLSLQQLIVAGIQKNKCSQYQYNMLRLFIFDIFKEKGNFNLKNYIETLNLFNQLQVERYGDTIIIRQHIKDHHHIN